ncbi:uncharacterized protein LOC107640255 [Arachis ipaensis]|uniref:uncharacterized protein LOC107640255 n=1 Tax=Arachis ipaensis TaxID=130454 RepID=UPI0007AF8B45|nr:uncharacterized protein LOC107640255 [Arachis ipaensis]XP_025651999.1 uncharacterized protein LOC112748006 [Arachis hypogaea]
MEGRETNLANEDDRKRLKAKRVIFFDDADIKGGLEAYRKSVIERILADKAFIVGTMKLAMYAIWRQPEGFRVIDHGGNTFQFFFEKQDLIRVEKDIPWLLKNYILNIKRWNKEMEIDIEEFSYVPIWIQLWRLPEYCKTCELGQKIGDIVREVLDVENFFMRGKEARVMKVKVNLDVTQKLKKIVTIVGPNKKIMEIQLKYERIGCFCSCCGHLGHEARSCNNWLDNSTSEDSREKEWSD